jgi:hypothetical protein
VVTITVRRRWKRSSHGSDVYDAGILTDEEFAAQKARILGT